MVSCLNVSNWRGMPSESLEVCFFVEKRGVVDGRKKSNMTGLEPSVLSPAVHINNFRSHCGVARGEETLFFVCFLLAGGWFFSRFGFVCEGRKVGKERFTWGSSVVYWVL